MQSELPEFELPASPPPIVERMWAAKDLHYSKPGSWTTKLTYGRMTTLLQQDDSNGGPSSQATQERARKDYPDLFPEYWPPQREDVRPWLADPSLLIKALAKARAKALAKARAKALAAEPAESDRAEVVVLGRIAGTEQPVSIQMTMDLSSGTLIGRIVSMAAAGLSVAALLDLADGRVDHVVRWCRVLQEAQRFLG